MLDLGKTKIGSKIERVFDGRKGEVISFDSFNTVCVQWEDGDFEYTVKHQEVDNIEESVNKQTDDTICVNRKYFEKLVSFYEQYS